MARKKKSEKLSVITEEPAEVKTYLPYAEDPAVKKAEEEGFIVLSAERDSNYLFIEIEAPTFEDAAGAVSRKLAYDIRYHYGFDKAGIEPYGGPVAHNGRYRQTWKLTRSLV